MDAQEAAQMIKSLIHIAETAQQDRWRKERHAKAKRAYANKKAAAASLELPEDGGAEEGGQGDAQEASVEGSFKSALPEPKVRAPPKTQAKKLKHARASKESLASDAADVAAGTDEQGSERHSDAGLSFASTADPIAAASEAFPQALDVDAQPGPGSAKQPKSPPLSMEFSLGEAVASIVESARQVVESARGILAPAEAGGARLRTPQGLPTLHEDDGSWDDDTPGAKEAAVAKAAEEAAAVKAAEAAATAKAAEEAAVAKAAEEAAVMAAAKAAEVAAAAKAAEVAAAAKKAEEAAAAKAAEEAAKAAKEAAEHAPASKAPEETAVAKGPAEEARVVVQANAAAAPSGAVLAPGINTADTTDSGSGDGIRPAPTVTPALEVAPAAPPLASAPATATTQGTTSPISAAPESTPAAASVVLATSPAPAASDAVVASPGAAPVAEVAALDKGSSGGAAGVFACIARCLPPPKEGAASLSA